MKLRHFYLAGLLTLFIAGLPGCTGHTEYGECIGAFDDNDPHLVYAASGWNIFLAIVFSETILVPAIVVISEVKCPRGTK